MPTTPLLLTTSAVKQYIASQAARDLPQKWKFGPIKDVMAIQGGTTNFIYRLFFETPYQLPGEGFSQASSAILKHATGYLACDPDTSFGLERQHFEASILQQIHQLLPADLHFVKVPRLLYFNPEDAVLVIEDISPSLLSPTLGHSLESSHSDYKVCSVNELCSGTCYSKETDVALAKALGKRLGFWLAELHAHGVVDTDLIKELKRNKAALALEIKGTFGDALFQLGAIGVQLSEQQWQLVANIMNECATPSTELTCIMGDFWFEQPHQLLAHC